MSDRYISYDVFNGDADGICALHQLRLAMPRPEAVLITGVKRDIRLLGKIAGVANADITVLDISLDSNRKELEGLLKNDCRVTYFDHHFAGHIPDSDLLRAHIDIDPGTCTSLIVDRFLQGKYRAWAVVAAFGDNQHEAAAAAAATINLAAGEVGRLKELGELLNYNGYGKSLADLHFAPDKLYVSLHAYEDPLRYYEKSEVPDRLRNGYNKDMNLALGVAPFAQNDISRIFRFPAASWARRVAGSFINSQARENKDMAHALIVDNGDETCMVSVRAPLNRKNGADLICRQFPTGGGRAAAAGINSLPEKQIEFFLHSFDKVFRQ